MKKKYMVFMIIYFLVVGLIIFGTDNLEIISTALEYVRCGDSKGIPKPMPMLTSWAFTILLIGVPIVLIIFSIITLAKSTVAGNADEMTKARGKLFKKLIATALAFLVVAFTRYVLSTASTTHSDKNTIPSCLNCYLFNQCTVDTTTNEDRYKTSETVKKKTSNTTSNTSTSNKVVTSNKTSNNTDSITSNSTTVAATKTLFVGDSRTVGMCGYSGMNLYNGANCRDYKVIAKVGIYYDAFSNTVISAVTNYVNSTSDKYNIVILMGVNDLAGDIDANEKADNYLIKINSLSRSDWKNHNIIFVSIPPVQNNNKYNIKPSNVNIFNQNVKNKINSANISNFKYCDINTGFSTDGIYESDGLHYNSKGYLNLYNQVVNKCL